MRIQHRLIDVEVWVWFTNFRALYIVIVTFHYYFLLNLEEKYLLHYKERCGAGRQGVGGLVL